MSRSRFANKSAPGSCEMYNQMQEQSKGNLCERLSPDPEKVHDVSFDAVKILTGTETSW